MRCKDCKHWMKEILPTGYQNCLHPKLLYRYPYRFKSPEGLEQELVTDPDTLIYWDAEEYGAGMYVGPEFGCVYFERREE